MAKYTLLTKEDKERNDVIIGVYYSIASFSDTYDILKEKIKQRDGFYLWSFDECDNYKYNSNFCHFKTGIMGHTFKMTKTTAEIIYDIYLGKKPKVQK